MPDMGSYQLVIDALAAGGFTPIPSDVPTHHRTYFPLAGPQGQKTGMYLEVQCWKDGKFGVHMDTVEGLPGIVAQAIAQVAGQGIITGSGEPQFIIPIAVLSALDVEVTVMARSPQGSFWTPQSTRKE